MEEPISLDPFWLLLQHLVMLYPILTDQSMTARTQIAPGVHNVLHQIGYSSDPEEVRIHFELTSPSRHVRGHERHVSP